MNEKKIRIKKSSINIQVQKKNKHLSNKKLLIKIKHIIVIKKINKVLKKLLMNRKDMFINHSS